MDSRHEFHPEQLSRRGEAILWILSLVSLAALVIAVVQTGEVSTWNLVFVVLMLLSAGGVSLGNWMDRQMVLALEPGGLTFLNGLRSVSLKWDDVQSLQVIPSPWGDQVHVIGQESHFSFRTLGEISHKGKVRNRMGFAQGTFITEQIINHSGLEIIDKRDKGCYYARP